MTRFAVRLNSLLWVSADDEDAARHAANEKLTDLATDGVISDLEFEIVDLVDEVDA